MNNEIRNISFLVESEHYIAQCHELLNNVNVPVDLTANITETQKLYNRLTAYIVQRQNSDDYHESL